MFPFEDKGTKVPVVEGKETLSGLVPDYPEWRNEAVLEASTG